MAMSASSLKSRIVTNLTNAGFDVTATGKDGITWMDKFLDAISQAIIDEITSNAEAVGQDSNGDTHDLSII